MNYDANQQPIKTDGDVLRRFLFEGLGVRGEAVFLDSAWRAVQDIHNYPNQVASQLGQALAATALLAATIKLQGSLILQVQGDGPLHTLVAQATSQRTLRGLARWREPLPDEGQSAPLFGDGRLVMTADAEAGERYQGIVSLEGEDLARALTAYFRQSEQLPTRLWLAADGNRAAGLLIQRLPRPQPAPQGRTTDEDWERIQALAATLTQDELLSLSTDDLLYRLFHEEDVRLFEPEPLAFRCSCSRDRIAESLRAVGRSEMDSVLEEQGTVTVDCEFCNRRYQFDPVDIATVFADSVPTASSGGQQSGTKH